MMSTCARNMQRREIKLIVKQKFCASSWLNIEVKKNCVPSYKYCTLVDLGQLSVFMLL